MDQFMAKKDPTIKMNHAAAQEHVPRAEQNNKTPGNLLPAKSMVTQNLTQKQNTKDPSHHPSRDIYSDYFPKNPGEK